MFKKIKKLFWTITFFVYALVFGKKPGPEAQNFIKSLGFVFSGLTLAKVFSLTFQIMSGRLLGVEEYGKFTLAHSISSIIWIFMYLSLGTAMVKYLSSARNERDRAEIFSTGIILTAIATIASAVSFYILSATISAAFSISLPYMLASIVMAVGMNIWTLTQKVCQGLNRMKKLGALHVVWSLSVLVISMILYLYTRTAIIPIISLIAGYLISSAFIIPDIRKYLRVGFSRKWSKTLLKYGLICILANASFSLLGTVNKIFLNIFLTVGDVGLYQAYFYSTLIVASFFLNGFITVFFPASSMYKDKSIIFSRIRRLLKFSPLFYIMLFFVSSAILFLYGSEYALIIPMLLLFVFAGLITMVHNIYIWFAASFGLAGVKLSTEAEVITCSLNIATAWFLIQSHGLYGAIISIIIAYIIGTLFLYFRIRSVLVPGPVQSPGQVPVISDSM